MGLLKTTIARPLKNDGIAKLAAIKADCMAALPVAQASLPASLLGDGTAQAGMPALLFSAWAQESHELAKTVAYDELEHHDTPNAAYVTNAQRVVRERVALAGYRLAALLNELFK